MVGGEGGQQRHQAFGGEVLGHPQAQHTGAFQVAHGVARLFLQGEQAPRIAQQALAFDRGHHAALAAVEQAAAGVVFQAAQLLADGGLGEVQALGGAGEVAAVGHCHEAAQELRVEHGVMPSATGLHGHI